MRSLHFQRELITLPCNKTGIIQHSQTGGSTVTLERMKEKNKTNHSDIGALQIVHIWEICIGHIKGYRKNP